MWYVLRLTIIVCALAFTSAAEFAPCRTDRPSAVNHRDGITELNLNLVEAGGNVSARAFIPDSDKPVAGIVFSHSTIHGATADADLAQFAKGLARAGAASIVLRGTIEWQIPNDNSLQPYHLTRCAFLWLLHNVNMDRDRLAEAGPGKWVGDDGYYCVEGEEIPCYHGHA